MADIISFKKEPEFKSDLTVIKMLEHLITDLKNDSNPPNKAFIVMLDDTNTNNDDYIISYDHNMKLSECITLNRIAEARFLMRMGFIPDDEIQI